MTKRAGKGKAAVVLLLCAVAGWAYCGMLIGFGRLLFSLQTTLVIHAVGAPLGFALLSWLYFKRFGYTTPFATAAVFLAVVMGLDAFLVAPVFEHSYAMFASVLGTWLPFILIFAATYLTGHTVRRKVRA